MLPTKAIIAAAGYGTRMLPITKVIEKAMMPLLSRPVIDYIVQDVIKAGVKDIYFVVSEDSSQLQAYYKRNYQLEEYLKSENKADLIEMITPPDNVRFHYVVQKRSDPRYGTAIPLWLCREFIENEEQFYLIMGDQTLLSSGEHSEAALLLEESVRFNKLSALIAVEIPDKLTSMYGVIDVDEKNNFLGITERPAPGKLFSNLLNASFYLLPAEILEYLEKYIDSGTDGEYLITDVLNAYAKNGNNVHVHRSDATYLDCGNLEAWVSANQLLLSRSS